MTKKKVGAGLTKPIIYTDVDNDSDRIRKLHEQSVIDYQRYEDEREQAEKDSKEFWVKYDKRLAELARETKDKVASLVIRDESSELTKEQVEYLRTRPKYVIGVDPANGKDQAIYNGKVVK